MSRLFSCLFLALLLTTPARASSNILLIIADDMGLDASAIYNPTGDVAPTPNIAALAAGGIKFTNAYAYTVCSPSRSAMLTGRMAFRTGTANVVGGTSSNNNLKSTEFTLPAAFAANSALQYQIKHIGKWHLGDGNTGPTVVGGWPTFQGALLGQLEDYYAWTKVTAAGTSATSTTSTTYATTDNVNDATSFITSQTTAGKPWFLWLAFNAPHVPYHMPPTSLLTTAKSQALSGTAADIAANPRDYFNASIEALDTEIGRLLQSVNLATTTVIFMGDNGTEPTVLQSPYPANRGKGTLYEGGIRVPLIIRGPDVATPGSTSTQLVHVCDLYATILELAGINVATTTAGITQDTKSLMPVLKNTGGSVHTQIFDDYWDFGFPTLAYSGRCLRDSQYKLIRPQSGSDEFYDLSADPYEAVNLSGSMTAAQTTAYNNLSTQMGSYNTPPTISSVAGQAVAQGTGTGAISFSVGDAELNPAVLEVTATSSNTTVVPAANIVLGGSGTSRTATVTPASGQNGNATITLTVNDGIFTTSSSFLVSVGQPASVSNVAQTPASATNTDAVTVTASALPGGGATLSGVSLQYSTGAQVTSTVFRETFSAGSTAGGLAGANNAWTTTTVRNTQDVKQRGGTGNNTAPIVLTNGATTSGSTTVTCGSTTGLWPGMLVSGTNIPAGATVSSVTNGTTFTLSSAATGTGTGLSLTVAGVTLNSCSLGTSPTVNTASTSGLAVGMGIAGTGLTTNPPGPVVAAVTNGTSFTLNSTVTAVPTTLTASGCGLELSIGTSTYTDTMATLSSPINAAGASAGGIDFYVRTAGLASNNGWTFQVSPDGGTTWNTRLSESYSAASASSCTLNATTTVSCSNTSGLTVGNIVQGSTSTLTNCTTNGTATVGCSNTSGLVVGMFVSGGANAGIPANSRITAITANTSITLNNAATTTGTYTLLANYLNQNTTITAITPNVSFTLSTAAFVSASGVTLSSVNHGFQDMHYSFTSAELTSSLKFRFQWSGGTVTQPAPNPACDIDDIIVTLTTGAAPQTITMYDDGLHGDGAAGDGVYGATIPQQAAGTTVSYTITATDSLGGTATGAGSYTVATAAPVLAVSPTTTLSASGTVGSGAYTPSSLAYTLTNTGTGTMSWTAANTAAWLSLSSTSGSLAAGASTTVTASINATAASSLSAATYSDTISFTNTTTGSGNTTRAASLLITNGTPTAPAAPVLTMSAYSSGGSGSITWPAVATATSYTIQIASSSNFSTSLLATQTVTSPYASFSGLTNGATYYYRVLATNSIGSSAYSSTVSSTQDSVPPTVAISTPATGGSTAASVITVTGTSSDATSGISGVKVNNVAATSSNNFATWTATVPLGFGSNALIATATDGAGNLAASSAVIVTLTTAQTYNPLIIPAALNGTAFSLDLYQTNKRFPTYSTSNPTLGINPSTTLGTAPGTTTMGYNGALMWGPTLILNQGDTVQINVSNHLDQSSSTLLLSTTTTVHWHGFHIPAIMDGGPRQVVAGGSTWSPTFTVKNNAATYWYHPHLHMATQEQLTLGAGGFIIVRDPQEAALALPRTYGIDDIPLAVTTRRFLATTNEFSANQYVQSDGSTSSTDNYGDYVLVNGTMNPQVSLPKQIVRLRILNADIQRGYRFGFSDNRNFYIIGNDQGLLNAPVQVSQVTMMIGERVEILVDLSQDSVGGSIDLKAYNNLGTAGGPGGAMFGFGGSESNSRTPNGASGPENGGLLCNSDFVVLHINIAAATTGAITSVPSTLASNTYWTSSNATTTRTISVTGGNGSTPGFTFNNLAYSPTLFNYSIPLNAVEKWVIQGGGVFGHSFHMHDTKFNIIARNLLAGGNSTQIVNTVSGATSATNGLAASYESGWKDTVYVPKGETVTVIAKFDDFASPANPYMFHCHMLNHEDGGLMGQFVVTSSATETLAVASSTRYAGTSTVGFDFNATLGSSYLVQYSADMTSGSWTTVGTATSDGSTATYTETDGSRLGQARGFYRAVIQSVAAPPVITSSTTATATHGAAFSYQITATNSPTGYSAILQSGNTAVPGGLSVNPSTGLISGTPTTVGTYNIDICASNSGGTTHQTVVLTVQ
jgi:blue copper oxidase